METGLQKLNHQQKAAQWGERIASCRSSGLTVRQWCSTFTTNDYKALVAKLNDGTITVDNDVTKNAADFATVTSVEDIGNLR